ncbi:glycyl-radical enzyme activating protein [Eubacterium barkeri]|uniref:Pyruvate formate lyase activating enzyme n=1 Tax=Eubacterium barkeri TaxID=1528 RepID=A0A1H3ANX5_EUBBA|nr:glycyl-radical enzyme activating protein [Eubacterium barkeri]SDX31323.1 pyruvate formate lyase activating enzyme [Eubacterium barkeri]
MQMKIDYEGKEKQGLVLRIERSSIYDGEGFRTVVFLKGCYLNCWWCSTPESQRFKIEETESTVYGRIMTVEEVLKEVRKDSPFYFHSGGGLTVSGGELLAQPEFSQLLLKQARREGIDTAIETSFYAKWPTVKSILSHVNTAFVDLKFYSEDRHQKYCGVSNALILENLLATNDYAEKLRLIVRIPIIPGVNDDEKELRRMGEFCRGLQHLSYLQLLPYHRLGNDTYRKLGIPYKLEGTLPPDKDRMTEIRKMMEEYVPTVL